MMWLVAVILTTVPSVTSHCSKAFKLTPSYPSAKFETPNYPQVHNPKEECHWSVIAPNDATKLVLYCTLDIHANRDPPYCPFVELSFLYEGAERTVCGQKIFSTALEGNYNQFTFRSKLSSNRMYTGLSCTVNYNPQDILDTMTPSYNTYPCGQKGRQRIVGGNQVTGYEYPWHAMLKKLVPEVILCAGSLIARQWVLSATHCIENLLPSVLSVLLGMHSMRILQPHYLQTNVEMIIKHEHYDKIKRNNDIALVKLVVPLNFDDAISPICLPFHLKDYDFTGETGTITGWGQTNRGQAKSHSEVLKEFDQNIIMHYACSLYEYYFGEHQINERKICAVGENGGACNGDHGGPLVWKSTSIDRYFQLGIMSSFKPCNRGSLPNLYTRVSHFTPWILENVGEGAFC